jgi:[ribosomal protein S5]-alanine N-acetyltransferase
VSLTSQADFGRMTAHRLDQMLEDRSYRFGVFVARTGEFIGEVMLFDVLRGNRQMASIGAVVHTAYRQQGYASEALCGLTRFGFRRLHLHRIEGQARPENVISIHMCRSVGFQEEGISVGRFKEGGRWFDALILAMVRGRKR